VIVRIIIGNKSRLAKIEFQMCHVGRHYTRSYYGVILIATNISLSYKTQ